MNFHEVYWTTPGVSNYWMQFTGKISCQNCYQV